MNLSEKKLNNSIDVGLLLVVFFYSIIYFVNSYIYANICFPNCYAWKDLMIKWTEGELIRRGLLGYVFYESESVISIKPFATLLFYIFYLVPIIVIYKKLRLLKLPFWLLMTIMCSPALFLFNLHESLVYKKDITVVFAVTISLLSLEYILNNVLLNIKCKFLLTFLSYIAIYIVFLLIYEVFAFFVPIILLYVYSCLSNIVDFKKNACFVIFLLACSVILFLILVIPNIGNEHSVVKIVRDWTEIYPDLRIFVDALYDFDGPVDPYAFLMMSRDRYIDYYTYIWNNTSVYQLLLIYILQFLPFIFVYKFCQTKDEFAKVKYLRPLALFAVHAPLIISFVAFDFGRWIVFVLYLSVFYICFFMRETNENFNRSFYYNKWFRFIIPILSTVYILLWVPYHWSPDGTIIEFNWYLVNLFLKIYQFFFVYGFV